MPRYLNIAVQRFQASLTQFPCLVLSSRNGRQNKRAIISGKIGFWQEGDRHKFIILNHLIGRNPELHGVTGQPSFRSRFGKTVRLYKATDIYAPESERTIAWNDSDLKIGWKLNGEANISAKDQRGVPFRDAETFE